jgi:hypothetical protein
MGHHVDLCFGRKHCVYVFLGYEGKLLTKCESTQIHKPEYCSLIRKLLWKCI